MMDAQIVTFIFSALQRLEKDFSHLRDLTETQSGGESRLRCKLADIESFLCSMRRVANKLQFAVARNDASEVHRLLQTFYGLRSIAKSEVIISINRLSKGISFKKHTQTQVAKSFYH